MKSGIHPQYGPARIKCACGNEVRIQSTLSDIQVEICSACHPFYTGKKKIIDSTGRVDKFLKRFAKTQDLKKKLQNQKAKKTKVKKQTSKK